MAYSCIDNNIFYRSVTNGSFATFLPYFIRVCSFSFSECGHSWCQACSRFPILSFYFFYSFNIIISSRRVPFSVLACNMCVIYGYGHRVRVMFSCRCLRFVMVRVLFLWLVKKNEVSASLLMHLIHIEYLEFQFFFIRRKFTWKKKRRKTSTQTHTAMVTRHRGVEKKTCWIKAQPMYIFDYKWTGKARKLNKQTKNHLLHKSIRMANASRVR